MDSKSYVHPFPSVIVPSDEPVDAPRLTSPGLSLSFRSSFAMPESNLDFLVDRARRDMYAHLQMSLDGHWAFCESSLVNLKKEIQEAHISRLPTVMSGEDKTGGPAQDAAIPCDDKALQEPNGRLLPGLPEEKSTPSQVGGENRPSKFISRAAGEKRRQNLSPYARMMTSPQFDATVGFLIISNCVFMGIQVESDDTKFEIVALQITFCVLFAIELILRISAERRRFYQRNILWNIFDCVTVFGSILELVIKFSLKGPNKNGSQLMLLRCLRFLRFLRVSRMLRVKAFRELRLMVQSMLCCMKPLTWTVSLLVMVIYIFSIVFAQATNDALAAGTIPSEHRKLLVENFSTMTQSMYALLAFILGGTDWLEYATALGAIGWAYKICLCGYVIFTQLALLNVVTAIFVDSSMKAALDDKQMLIQEEMMREGLHKAELEKLYIEAIEASGASGMLTVQQLRQYLEDDQVKAYLKVMEVHYRESKDLVRVLDKS